MLQSLFLKTHKNIFSQTEGEHNSPFAAQGYDFTGLNEYQYGDNINHIDWKASSKSSSIQVKNFAAERELNLVLVPLLSKTLFFGTQESKQETLMRVCSLLAYSSIEQNDSFTGYLAHESLELLTEKSREINTFFTFINRLEKSNVLQYNINYENISKQLYEKIQKPSTLFLIGDFLDTPALNLQVLSQKHEVYLIIIRDKFEEAPSTLGEIQVNDNHKSKNIIFDKKSIQTYIKKFKKHDDDFYKKLQQSSVKYTKIYTDESPLSKLIKLMETV
jgi:uncharacterized protein (DUF58 family)